MNITLHEINRSPLGYSAGDSKGDTEVHDGRSG